MKFDVPRYGYLELSNGRFHNVGLELIEADDGHTVEIKTRQLPATVSSRIIYHKHWVYRLLARLGLVPHGIIVRSGLFTQDP
jgi:RNA:NAD 2'-phosphotransferase (TPT1/KptA family)